MSTSDLFQIRDTINKIVTTDKEDSYIENFEEFFKYIRYKDNINFLEIGIFNGASLLMWGEYFKDATIYGIDIKKNLPDEFYYYQKHHYKHKNRVIPFFDKEIPGHDVDIEHRKKFFNSFIGDLLFDVILDDGAHTYTHTKGAFEVLFNDYLKPGGIYIIEDWGTSYFPDWIDGSRNGETGVARIIKELYDEVAIIDRIKGKKIKDIENYKSKIKSLTIRFGQIFIIKADE